jgi:hypothetical protein
VDLYNFSVPCIAITNRLIGWIFHVTAGITRLHAMHAFDVIENCFQAPETSTSQCCGMKICAHKITPFLKLASLPAQLDGMSLPNLIKKVLQVDFMV